MPRGRQYYDPEIQVNRPVETPADLARIEFYPELDGSGQIGRWVARRIDHDGRIVGYTNGNFDHDAELAHAQELWPGLTVYELPDEQTDSTWEGTGPSPRIWQNSSPETGAATPPAVAPFSGGPSSDAWGSGAGDEQLLTPVLDEQQMPLHVIVAAQPGTYVLLNDVRILLLEYARAYDDDKNPSAAMALRDAVDALKDVQ